MPAMFAAVAGLFGLTIGSFLNVVIHRLPIMMEQDWRRQCAELEQREAPEQTPYNLLRPRSACPGCNRPIRASENVPLLSWLLLRGKCAGCGQSISVRYPLVELLTGILSALVAWRFGVTWETVAALALTWSLVTLAGIDFDTKLLPDSITLPLLWLGLFLSLFYPQADAQRLFIDPRTAIIGAAAGYLSLWSVYQLFKLTTGKEGMGYGDFKLLGALGAWLGWQALPLIIILSAVVGAVVGVALILLARHGREVPMPFGPFLAAAGWIALMWGDTLTGHYMRITGMS
ncbi:MAG: A24 family peptidase [Gammaproteobacteria bacterium]|nr:A24 family peptidase [Gammaproteobacteria bacterium]NNF62152.1 prepilin peptidase [Gammaproteobacteria bacterium]NNM21843.1 prepilin peptidase [Gammaproteobacteria bacterium]